MDHERGGRLLYVSLAALGVWLILAAGSLTWLDRDTAMLGWVLLALTTTLAVTDLFRYAGWVAASIGSLLYAGFQMTLCGPTESAIVNTGVAAVGLIGVALLSSSVMKQIGTAARQLERNRKLIDELTIHDPKTKLVKWQYARHTLKSEIARSRRYHSDLSLLIMRVANLDEVAEHDPAAADDLIIRVSRVVVDRLRTMDSPTLLDSVTLAAILPETSSEGALRIAQHLSDGVARKTRAALYVGIAHFPHDAVTEGELVRAAEAALHFGLQSGQSIVRYEQLRNTTGMGEGDAILEARTRPERQQAKLQKQEGERLTAVQLETPPSLEEVPSSGGGMLPASDQSVFETQVRIVGLRQIAWLHHIEKVLKAFPSVENVKLIMYDKGILVLGVRHRSAPLPSILMALPGLSVQGVHEMNGWIEVHLNNTNKNSPTEA
jgi:GGDEF domain-containing protein